MDTRNDIARIVYDDAHEDEVAARRQGDDCPTCVDYVLDQDGTCAGCTVTAAVEEFGGPTALIPLVQSGALLSPPKWGWA